MKLYVEFVGKLIVTFFTPRILYVPNVVECNILLLRTDRRLTSLSGSAFLEELQMAISR